MIPANNQNNEPMRSVHTSNFPQILKQLGISLVVFTYQAGKVIVLREDGERINTHFRIYSKPMGIAANRKRIAIGCASQIWELHNMPAIAPKLEPLGKHNACYIPRNVHITGDIDIHEMAWGEADFSVMMSCHEFNNYQLSIINYKSLSNSNSAR